jgi:hypothetical protein
MMKRPWASTSKACGKYCCKTARLRWLMVCSDKTGGLSVTACPSINSGFRLGLAWLGLAWLGLAWLGLAWLGLAWLGLAWLGLALYLYFSLVKLFLLSACNLNYFIPCYPYFRYLPQSNLLFGQWSQKKPVF